MPWQAHLRHRAAMGMAEISDASIVVVSEESGTITLVSGNKMRRGLSTDELRKRLLDQFGRTPRPPKAEKGALSFSFGRRGTEGGGK